MARGRPPIPSERRAVSAKGDGQLPGGHRPGTDLVPRGPGRGYIKIPDPPEGVGGRGLTEWNNIWKAGQVWLHPTEDYHWVEMIARAYNDIVQFRKKIEEDGLIVKGYAGQLTAHPLLREIREAEAVIRKCLSILGFSPTDRARLGLAEIKRQSKIMDLQNRIGDVRNGKA